MLSATKTLIESVRHDSSKLESQSQGNSVEQLNPNDNAKTIEVLNIQNEKEIDHLIYDRNKKLSIGDYLLVSFENLGGRRKRLYRKFSPFFGFFYYYGIDFFCYRVLARLKATRSIFLTLSGGKNQVISVAEGLGRLASCNFDIVSYKSEGGITYALGQKIAEIDEVPQSSQGVVIALKRVGYQGKLIKVWKVRSMRPYSEFLQSYLMEKHGTDDGDKIINDFRVARWGMILRKFWIDELPMIWNLLKGDLKLVGVRPLSRSKFQVYPDSLQELRVKVKPGLLPPYYADLPKNPEEFFKSEEEYTLRYLKNPLKTDVQYFFKILYNIIIKGSRST